MPMTANDHGPDASSACRSTSQGDQIADLFLCSGMQIKLIDGGDRRLYTKDSKSTMLLGDGIGGFTVASTHSAGNAAAIGDMNVRFPLDFPPHSASVAVCHCQA